MNLAGYSLLEGFDGRFQKYEITSVREGDVLSIMRWRNAQIDALRQKTPLTEDKQLHYFREVVFPTFEMEEPPMIILAFLKQGKLIGYGGIVHLDWESRRGEVSFLLDPIRTEDKQFYGQELGIFLSLLKKLAFKQLELNRLTTEAYGNRLWHVQAIEANGFLREGILRQQVSKGDELVDVYLHGFLSKDFEKNEY
ncbi:MAG: GNAT family N-acetyltransferase [Opitutae bacterium]|nr:GNAT family N-acetyltransferase [Opitutae bacterium]|tara:strand:+ start:1431 stop:2018 length:588 start_codon:yes stop_codon:yes gene_type:complete